jgi:hypothetical protein
MISGYSILNRRGSFGFLPPDEVTCVGKCSPSDPAYQTIQAPVPNLALHAGCHGHFKTNDKDGFCDYKSYNEFTLRGFFGVQFWRQNLEYIVRKNLEFYCTKEGIDNTLWDIQTDLRNRGLSTNPWFNEQTSSSLQIMLDRFNVIFPANMWAFMQAPTPYGLVDVPYRVQRPDQAAFVSALNAILGHAPTAQEQFSVPESMYSVIEDVPRWSKANVWNQPIPPEWGQGAWWEQPPGVGGGLLTFFTVLGTGEVVPGPWMSRMLDVFVPGWKKKTQIQASSTKTVMKKTVNTKTSLISSTKTSGASLYMSGGLVRKSSTGSAAGSGGAVLFVSALVGCAVVAYVALGR